MTTFFILCPRTLNSQLFVNKLAGVSAKTTTGLLFKLIMNMDKFSAELEKILHFMR